MTEDLTQASSHFAFGKNWAAFAEKITEAAIIEAEKGLVRLLGERLEGQRLLDIGCGSGLHALAALRRGAREVVAVDIDADSVETTRAVLHKYFPEGPWQVVRISVFDLSVGELGTFEIVYSWGVLHHTGAMCKAIRHAAEFVAADGRFAFALYRRTWMDFFWRKEKYFYSKASPTVQKNVMYIYIYIYMYRLRLFTLMRSFKKYRENYCKSRGMDMMHDVHDWLGGYPYASISAHEVALIMREAGFSEEKIYSEKGRFFGRDPGIFGSGCDEYVYKRRW